MMGFFSRVLGIDDNKKIIEEKFLDMQNKFTSEFASIKNENASLKEILSEKEGKIAILNRAIREQNEADLFLECEKIKQKIIAGEKREEIGLSIYQSLRQQAESHQRMAMNQGIAGLIGGSGNSFFGRHI